MADPRTAQSLADFWIRVPTRHPAAQGGYDAERHRYRPDYVRPRGWAMELTAAFPGTDEPPSPRPLGKELPGADDDPLVLPGNIRSYTWTVTALGGPFTTTVIKQREMFQPWRARVMVPRPGSYEVHLAVQTTGGPVQNSRIFRIRDSLMVSIGESFAAGQGNPDIRRVPSDSQALKCQQTSLSMIRNTIAGMLDEQQGKLEDRGHLGKLVAAELEVIERHAALAEAIGEAVVDGVAEFGRLLFGRPSGPKPRPARWQEPRAYRSYQSGPSRAAYLLESESETHADRVTFLSFARSGAEIQDGLLGPRTVEDEPIDGWIGNIGEIQEVVNTVGDRPIDMLHISIGGNDVDFAAALRKIVRGDFPDYVWATPWALALQAGNDADARQAVVDKAREGLDNLRSLDGFPALAEAVAGLRPRQVYINEYPIGLFEKLDAAGNTIDGESCGVFSGPDVDLSDEDWRAIRALGVELNALIHEVAADQEWVLIDGITEAFAGHGYCATADSGRPGAATNRRGSYFVSAEQSCRNQGDFEGTMHPNEHGHEVFAARLAEVVGAPAGPRDPWLVPTRHAMTSPRALPFLTDLSITRP